MVALLITPKSDKKVVEAVKAACKKAGVNAEAVIPQFSMNKDNDQVADVEQCLSSTPSHRYDGVFVFANAADYTEGKDLGCALRFIGQAFKHCKTIGANDQGSDLVAQATMKMHLKSPGVVMGKKDGAAMAKEFLSQLAEHRHWEREEPAAALPY
ncbi:MAG: hypothetical protein EOP04_14410 [Proteobacteria bacterium]|nr:MAG: hypothetical protein EOP04_14410 [Pseudomonadota bacterium]